MQAQHMQQQQQQQMLQAQQLQQMQQMQVSFSNLVLLNNKTIPFMCFCFVCLKQFIFYIIFVCYHLFYRFRYFNSIYFI